MSKRSRCTTRFLYSFLWTQMHLYHVHGPREDQTKTFKHIAANILSNTPSPSRDMFSQWHNFEKNVVDKFTSPPCGQSTCQSFEDQYLQELERLDVTLLSHDQPKFILELDGLFKAADEWIKTHAEEASLTAKRLTRRESRSLQNSMRRGRKSS